MKFRKKPVVIEAEQYRKDAKIAPCGVCTDPQPQCSKHPHVHTMHDNQIVRLKDGDWIIPEPDGIHFYPCDAEVFANTYVSAEAKSVLAQRWTFSAVPGGYVILEGFEEIYRSLHAIGLKKLADRHNASVLAQEAGETKSLGEKEP